MTRINSLNLKYIKINGDDNQEIFMIKIIMIREIIKIDIGQIAEIEEHETEVEVSMGKIIEEECITLIIIEMTIGETILEICRITKIKILEVDTEGIIEMIILKEVEVGLGTDNIPGLIEIEIDAISAGNMTILLKTVQLCR